MPAWSSASITVAMSPVATSMSKVDIDAEFLGWS